MDTKTGKSDQSPEPPDISRRPREPGCRRGNLEEARRGFFDRTVGVVDALGTPREIEAG